MAKKISALEFKRFYASEDPRFWPEEAYVDDVCFEIEGVEVNDPEPDELPDSAFIKIISGVIVRSDGSAVGLAGQFLKWRRAQTTTVLTVELPNEALERFKESIATLKGKIL